ncbi:MAG: alpha-2-macroglobulin family protein [Pseudomonadota bacterium]
MNERKGAVGAIGGWLLAALGWVGGVGAAEPAVKAELAYRAVEFEFAQPMLVWADDRQRAGVARIAPGGPLDCHWSDDLTLHCALPEPGMLPDGNRVRVDLAAGLRTQAGETLPARSFVLETERPRIHVNIVRWRDGRPEIELWSEARPTAEALRRVLRLSRNGLPLLLPPLRALPPRSERDTATRYTLDLPDEPPAGGIVSLSVEPGLIGTTGPLPGTQSGVLLRVRDREPFRLRNVYCQRYPDVAAGAVDAMGAPLALVCVPGEPIGLRFSQPLSKASREAFAARLPAGVRVHGWHDGIWYSGEIRDDAVRQTPDSVLGLTIDRADADIGLALETLLRAAEDDRPLQPQRLRLRTADYRPQLQARHPRLLLAAGAEPPVRALNTPMAEFAADALGDAARRETVRLPAARGGEAAPVAPATAQTLREGGWARWLWRTREPLEMAAPQIDLRAIATRTEVLAWVQAWDGSGALANAEIELFRWRSDEDAPHRVAGGRSGADGVARLRLPPGFELPALPKDAKGQWLLRATHPAGRAVLPFGNGDVYGLSLGTKANDDRMWGVSDRPLYRAAETVRYRLWHRIVRGGRLRASEASAPLDLRLFNVDEGKVIRSWTATPDADGTLVGEERLPAHLTDATYCIGIEGGDLGTEGSCFFVGTFRAQDLWAEATTEDRVLRDGDTFAVDLAAGYYSGGPASSAKIERVSTMLTGLSLSEAYPAYADYVFVDTFAGAGRSGVALQDAAASGGETRRTDAGGRARIALPVRFALREDSGALPAFGRLQLVAEVRLDAREGTASNAARTRYARYDRYVGLQITPRWFGARDPLRLKAVVVDADGRAVPQAAVEVTVEFMPGYEAAKDEQAQVLTRCTLKPEAEALCTVPRARSGRYRFVARSGDAAPATIERYVWVDDGTRTTGASDATRTTLALLEAPRADAPARLRLTQPHPHAAALLVATAGDALLGYRVLDLDRPQTEFLWPVAADGARRIELRAYVLARGTPSEIVDGLRRPLDMAVSDIAIDAPRRATPAAVAIAFDRASAKPGDTVTLRLRNAGDRPRRAAVTVNDDGLRALAADWLAYADPQGEHWLGANLKRWEDRPFEASFEDWNRGTWRRLLPWPDAATAQPADTRLPPPDDPDAPVVFDDQSPVDMPAGDRSRARASEIVHESPPAAAPAMIIDRAQIEAEGLTSAADSFGYASGNDGGALRALGGNDDELDRVVVTGSRVPDIAEIFSEGAGRLAGAQPRARGDSIAVRAHPDVRLRTRFSDVALWRDDVVLAPGETKTLTLTVPDNLTRWRATAWSADADDGFERAEATLDVGLPLEVRLQTPVRVFPGDTADLAANVRNGDDADVVVDIGLDVQSLRAAAARTLPLAARAQDAASLRIAPTDADLPANGGAATLAAVAVARTDTAGDAVSAPIELASPIVETRRVQAGWLGARSLTLALPTLPQGAHDAGVRVSLLPGADGLARGWIDGLHAYPHRCWEQILSRAVGAAIALERGDGERFPDAKDAIREALENAAVFQDETGAFRYFADDGGDGFDDDAPSPQRIALTAYSVRALRLLRALGHPVPETVLDEAEALLDGADTDALDVDDDTQGSGDDALQAVAIAFAAASEVDPIALDALWARWDALGMPARIAAARALANRSHPDADDAMERLVASARRRGETRVLHGDARDDRWMSSDLREQCELIALLAERPGFGDRALRRTFVAGLGDLYAGGPATVDTQTAAICLMALRALDPGRVDAAAPGPMPGVTPEILLEIALGDARGALRLTPDAQAPVWERPLAANARAPLRLAPKIDGDLPASYIAELRYREDARRAASTATGFALSRRYATLRDGRWTPLGDDALRDGDWVRITLILDTAAPRYFVALTDGVPGGLRPTDLALGGMAGLDLQQVSDTGADWFETRRLDPRAPKFYAEYLPAGRHEVHYFARVGNSGDYLAPPAVAELMYGAATRARTAAQGLRIAPTAP